MMIDDDGQNIHSNDPTTRIARYHRFCRGGKSDNKHWHCTQVPTGLEARLS